jgi:phosphatidylglycerophosphate synthase
VSVPTIQSFLKKRNICYIKGNILDEIIDTLLIYVGIIVLFIQYFPCLDLIVIVIIYRVRFRILSKQ